ncbi:MAG: lysophospholipase [Halioglobus sp.]
MQHREGQFGGAKGASIYFQYWQPESLPRAVIVLVHGAGEHSARYQHFAEFFTGQGFAVAAMDHPGHGRSEGTGGYIDSFSEYTETLHIFQQQVSAEFSGMPKVLLGHSMGGLISVNYLLENQQAFSACVLSGPAIKSDLEPGFLQMLIIRLLSSLLPKIGALQLDASGVSRDLAVVADYQADPLVYHGKLSARLIFELFLTMDTVQAQAAAITLPMLLLHGEKDNMASPSGSRFLHEHISSEKNRLEIYPGLYHEIFNEPEKEQVFGDILDWLTQEVGL